MDSDLSSGCHAKEFHTESCALLEAWHPLQEGRVCFQDNCQKLVDVDLVVSLCSV